MYPTGDFERLRWDVFTRYDDRDIPVTYGILIADYEQGLAKEYIINYLDIFNYKSGKHFDFFIPGYTQYGFDDDIPINFQIDQNTKYYFNRKIFSEFIIGLEKELNIDYTYNPMLILVESEYGNLRNSKKIIIELDEIGKGVTRCGQLFEGIFTIAKKYVSIDEIQMKLTKTYIRGNALDTIVNLIDNRFIKEIKGYYDNTKHYRIIDNRMDEIE